MSIINSSIWTMDYSFFTATPLSQFRKLQVSTVHIRDAKQGPIEQNLGVNRRESNKGP